MKTVDYFIKQLNLSRQHAKFRLSHGETLFGNDSAQYRASSDSATISGEARMIIQKALKKLEVPESRPDVFALGMRLAQAERPEVLKKLLDEKICELNAPVIDPHRARRNRTFKIGKQDADGGVSFSGYAPAAEAALLEAELAAGDKCGVGQPEKGEDKRTFDQKCLDAFAEVIRGHSWEKAQNATGGVCALDLSITDEDVQNLTSFSQLPSNTSVKLTPADVLGLGESKYGYTLLHDITGKILGMGRTTRHATIYQKMALLARDLVCTHQGSDRAAVWCDCHHIQSWANGGSTDLDNLTLLSRHHHTSNDDTRMRAGRGHADTCPQTGRVGFRTNGGNTEFNDSEVAVQSASAKIRQKYAA